ATARPADSSSLTAIRRRRSRTHADSASPERLAASSNASFSVSATRTWSSSSRRVPEPFFRLLCLVFIMAVLVNRQDVSTNNFEMSLHFHYTLPYGERSFTRRRWSDERPRS